jgi:hypothetical protein
MLTLLYVFVAASYWNEPLAVAVSEKVTPLRVYVTGDAGAPPIIKKGSKQRNSRDGFSIQRPFESCRANRCVIVITILLMHFSTVGLEPPSRGRGKDIFCNQLPMRACGRNR